MNGPCVGHNKAKLVNAILAYLVKYGAPDRSRTCDLWLRKPTLYPTELRARYQADIIANHGIIFAVNAVLLPWAKV